MYVLGPVIDVETGKGSQEPVYPLEEVVIKTGAIAPSQIDATGGKIGKTGTFTTAFTVLLEAQELAVTVTVYTPAAVIVAAGIDGFCSVEEKPFGPVQLYVDPADAVEVKFRVLPEHIGTAPATVLGIVLTTTLTELVDEQPVEATVTV